jgi:signal transduction histidine kinase/ligand-binding sensor domain-containing protein
MAHLSWTRRDGAPSDISALTQTKDGYLWIGSSFGLFRFDGLEFQSYPFTTADPRLPSSDISALAADRDGGLWIGYRMGGISYLNHGKKLDYGKSSGLVGESTEQLLCREDGFVWATADGLLMRFTGTGWENYSARHGLTSDGLYSLFFDRDSNLWTADKGHVYELKKGEDRFTPVAEKAEVVNQFAQLPNGQMWICDAWKMVRPLHDDHPANGVRIPGVPILLVDAGGTLWLANEFGGLTRIRHPEDAATRQVEYYTAANGLTDGQTRAILQDRQGAIWVGTTRGLDRLRPTPVVPFRGTTFDYYPALLADRNEGMWLHDMDKPLMRLRAGQLSYVGQGHGSSTLFQDSDGSIWMLDQISRNFFHYPENGGTPQRIAAPKEGTGGETWCMGRDVHGVFLACFEGHGLWSYNGAWKQVTVPGLPQETPISLKKAADGRVWLGYPHNQIVLNDATGYHLFGEKQGVALNSVSVIYDAGDRIIAGGSDGLAYYTGSRFQSLHLSTPALLRGISGIVKDRFGDLWLNAGSGIIRMPSSEWRKALADPSYAMDFQLLNEQDGLYGSPAQSKPTPSAVMDKSGRLWFATSGHLVSIDPALARNSTSTPNVLLQATLVNGTPLDEDEDHPVFGAARALKTLEFDYIGVDLQSPDRVHYEYMLEGQDREWQSAGNRRQAFYTNLPPGTYHFRVRAATGTGPWSELQAAAELTIKAPFYRTTWFYLLCCIPLFTLVWLLYRLRVQYITVQMRDRIEERAQERIRIARDLHDTLLQGVQGLVLRFHFATERLPPSEPARAMLREALDRADDVIAEGREKVRELRAEAVSAGDLDRYLLRTIEALEPGTTAKIRLLVEGGPVLLRPSVQDELYSISREALTNAVRHAHATEIVLELGYEQQQLRLCCRDNGVGVAPEVLRARAKEGHWGITGMRERARGLGCKLEFLSSPATGTRVQVLVEARKAYAHAEPGASWLAALRQVLSGRRQAPSDLT